MAIPMSSLAPFAQPWIKQSQDMYGKVQGQLARTQSQAQRRGQRLQNQYGAAQNRALADISGAGTYGSEQIASKYARDWGAMNQSMISRGLANTSALPSLARGIMRDAAHGQAELSEKIGGLYSNTRQAYDMPALAALDRTNERLANLGTRQADYMGDWQKSLFGGGIRVAELEQQRQMANANLSQRGGGGGGGGVRMGGGGGGGDSILRPFAPGGRSDPFYDDPYFDMNEGMGDLYSPAIAANAANNFGRQPTATPDMGGMNWAGMGAASGNQQQYNMPDQFGGYV